MLADLLLSRNYSFTNIWGRTDGIGAENGDVTFEINEAFFAVCGSRVEALGDGLVVKPSDHEKVSLRSGSTKGTLVNVKIEDGGVVIDKTKKGATEKTGSYAIKTSDYNMTQFSKKSPVGDANKVIPVAVWQAKPNQVYEVTPHVKYYISTGRCQPGTIVDVTNFGLVCEIDFTGKDENMASVVYNNNLKYEKVSYSFAGNP